MDFHAWRAQDHYCHASGGLAPSCPALFSAAPANDPRENGMGNAMTDLYRASTVVALLEAGAEDAPAIGAPDRAPLTHRGLRTLAARTVRDLNAMGIGHNDRVA